MFPANLVLSHHRTLQNVYRLHSGSITDLDTISKFLKDTATLIHILLHAAHRFKTQIAPNDGETGIRMTTQLASLPQGIGLFKLPSQLLNVLKNDVREIVNYRFALSSLVYFELKLRYHRSVLGFIWTLLHPLLMMTVIATFFSHFMGRGVENYALYLFSGMLPWSFFASTMTGCSQCLIQSEGTIRKIYLPKLLFPVSCTLTQFINLILSMTALFSLFVFLSAEIHWPLLMLPVGLVLLMCFSFGMGLLVATLNTFYRDVAHILTVVIQAGYFATPIIYQSEMVPERLQVLNKWNPMHLILDIFQSAIYYSEFPSSTNLLRATAFALVALILGYATFKHYEPRFIFRL